MNLDLHNRYVGNTEQTAQNCSHGQSSEFCMSGGGKDDVDTNKREEWHILKLTHLLPQLHGATYVVDCEFRTSELVPKLNWVVDIGHASSVLRGVLSKYNYKNLDELEQFRGQNTTTEYMCKQVFDDICEEMKGSFVGEIRVQLAESHTAWASYTGTMSWIQQSWLQYLQTIKQSLTERKHKYW